MLEKKSKNGWRLVPEIGLTALVIAGLINCAIRFHVDGKLPQPFIFDINDTFMDWFNTAYWAHHKGAFDLWQTVYPPLSFVFLKIFGFSQCYASNSITARDCDYLGIISILSCYLIGAWFAWLAFRKNDRQTSTFRALSFAFGLPLLFTLERGNLILPCLIFFVVGHSDLASSRWVKAISLAITVNFKPYLLIPILSHALKRNWRLIELVALCTVFVYLISLAILNDGSVFQIWRNVLEWTKLTTGLVWEQIYYSTSYAPFLEFDSYRFPTRDLIPYYIVDGISLIVPAIINISRILALVCIAGAWVQPSSLSRARISIILLAVSLIGQSPGGYTEVFLVFLLFLEKWRRPGPIIALTCGYLLCVPYDYVISNFVTLSGDSWLGGRPVTAPFGLSVGIFVRPGLIAIMFWALALDSIALLVRSHRTRRPTFALLPLGTVS